MKTLESPATLAERPSTFAERIPEYQWESQQRYGHISAGRYTSRSQQTFDSKGQPKDANSDNND